MLGLGALLSNVGACSSETTHGAGGGIAGGGGSAGKGGAAGAHPIAEQGGSSSRAGAGGAASNGGGGQAGVTQVSGGAGGVAGAGGGSPTGGAVTGGSANCDPKDSVPADPGDNACNSFTPCGGDLTGKWTLAKNCADPPFHSYSVLCQEGTDQTDLVGTLEFVAGGKYLGRAAFHSQGSVSQACIDGYNRACGQNPFEGCVPNDNGCQCDYTGPLSEPDANMTWNAQGNVLQTQTTDGCTINTFYYCVKGNALDLRSKSDTGQYFSAHATR